MRRPSHCLLCLALLGTGCRLYHTLPLDRDGALPPPDPAQLQVLTRDLHHPLLRPRAVDLRGGLTPADAALLAVVGNPDLKAVRGQRALAAAQLLEAGLLPDPVLSYGQDRPVGNEPGTTTAYNTQLSLDLTSLLTRGLRREAARAEQTAVDLEVAWAEWQVAEAAKLSTLRILALEPQARLAGSVVALQEAILAAVAPATGAGAATQADLAGTQAALDAARRAALTLNQGLDRERQTLNGLLGLPPGQALALRSEPGPRSWQAPPAGPDLVRMLPDRLDLVALRKGYDSEDAKVRLAVWSQFPSIGIALNQARDPYKILTRGYAVSASLPFLNGGRGQVALEYATRQQLHDQYQARLFSGRADLAQVLADLNLTRSMLAAAAAALPDLEAQAKASFAVRGRGELDLAGWSQAQGAYLGQQATVASLEGALDELGVALELASGTTLQPAEKQP
jgi:outer membrane protein TolC